MEEFQISNPMSEEEVVRVFAEHGITYETRAQRYKLMNNTMFARVRPKYYIAYHPTVKDGKPVAVQGIAPYKNIFLLTGLKSHATETGLSREQTRGAGLWVSKKVIDLHSHRPIVGEAMPKGLSVFVNRQGFQEIQFDGNRKVIGQDDIPEDVKEVFEKLARENAPTTAIRKLYYRPASNWFYIMRK
jgi:hypothetical protein